MDTLKTGYLLNTDYGWEILVESPMYMYILHVDIENLLRFKNAIDKRVVLHNWSRELS